MPHIEEKILVTTNQVMECEWTIECGYDSKAS